MTSPFAVDQRHRTGPFDVIGDVHGCIDELEDLLRVLGYETDASANWGSPEGRTAVFVGDFVDRGPSNAGVLRVAMQMVATAGALAVPGNHDVRLEEHLAGEPVPLIYGLAETVAELRREPEAFRRDVLTFLQQLPGHVVLDGGRLVVAHTGLAESFHGRDDAATRTLAAFGVLDEDMDPVDHAKRHAWIRDYSGTAAVAYGHTPMKEAVWHRNTADIDTGCPFGWRLTALRWPERTFVSVPARKAYAASMRKFF